MTTRDRAATVAGPIPVTPGSYPFNTTLRSTVPLDLAGYGYVEEEFFVSGDAAVYADDLAVEREVPYTNRVVVRRPISPARASGVVLLEILNASNGYPAEGLWRRAWDHLILHGHTWVGVTSKPIDIDALRIFDPERYAPLSWELDPDHPHAPVRGGDFDPLGGVVEGAEEGLVWDVITHLGRLLRAVGSGGLLGDLGPGLVVLGGQSQSGVMLNTWVRHFHPLVRRADGRPLFDAYLVSVASVVERPLRQQAAVGAGFATTPPGEGAPVDVPLVSITAEGDVNLWAGLGQDHVARPGLGDAAWRRTWCVPGAPHTELFTPVLPAADEVLRAGRAPRVMSAATVATGNTLPLQAVVTGALEALIAWARDGVAAAPSVYFEVDADGHPVRDDDGNVRGGVRVGLLEAPIARFVGSPGGGTLGTLELLPRDEVLRRYPTPDAYLTAVAAADDALVADGYLGDHGRRQLWDAAVQLYLRAVG